MKIIINETELIVTNCYPFRYPSGKLVLKIEVLQSAIGHDDLKELLKNNTSDIILVKDDESQSSFSGFTYAVEITDKDEKYYCELLCQSESDYQIGLLKQKNADLTALVNAQTETINALNETILTTQLALTELYESIAYTEATEEVTSNE